MWTGVGLEYYKLVRYIRKKCSVGDYSRGKYRTREILELMARAVLPLLKFKVWIIRVPTGEHT